MYRNPRINQPQGSNQRRVYIGAAVRDAVNVHACPGAVAIDEAGRVIAAGAVRAVLDASGSDIVRVDLPDQLLLPGLVNAHVHLDLTHIGHQSYGGDFIDWVKLVMERRATDTAAIGEAMRQGVDLSTRAGVLTVGDIAGSPDATRCLQDSPLRGVSFVEMFGLGVGYLADDTSLMDHVTRWAQPLDGNFMDNTDSVRLGCQPHAPYSAGPGLYEMAASSNRLNREPIATHLAETPEELQFVATGRGPFHDLLVALGKWRNAYDGLYGERLHPIDWLALYGNGERIIQTEIPQIPGAPEVTYKDQANWLCAHCNYVDDAHIEKMAQLGWSVAYCPRASDYFGHTGHRYRDMLAAGVNVCLGTDSIICHGTLSILDEMRHLHQRDATDPATLLKMATVNGMRALQMTAEEATFTPAARPGVVALGYDPMDETDALAQVLSGKQPPRIEVLEGVA